MEESIKFIHDCEYIHTDIKPENFLLIGLTKKQNDIKKYIEENNWCHKISKVCNDKKKFRVSELLNNTIYRLLEKLTQEFTLKKKYNKRFR